MGIAERNYLSSGELESIGENEDKDGTASIDYEWTGQLLKSLLINKLESGTDPALIIRRYSDGDGLKGFAEVVRYYVELTGQGMRELMRDVQHPTVAKKDEDVLKMVEKWEDEYKQAVR